MGSNISDAEITALMKFITHLMEWEKWSTRMTLMGFCGIIFTDKEKRAEYLTKQALKELYRITQNEYLRMGYNTRNLRKYYQSLYERCPTPNMKKFKRSHRLKFLVNEFGENRL